MKVIKLFGYNILIVKQLKYDYSKESCKCGVVGGGDVGRDDDGKCLICNRYTKERKIEIIINTIFELINNQ